jgi:transposase
MIRISSRRRLNAAISDDREVHVIGDNLGAHKTAKVENLLAAHPIATLHFTPTHPSWLNQVELWFSKVARDVIARGIFTSSRPCPNAPSVH